MPVAKVAEIEFEGLKPEESTRLRQFIGEVYAGIAREAENILVGAAGRPYRHELPYDVAGNVTMLSHLGQWFSSGEDVVATIEYGIQEHEYLKITRRAGVYYLAEPSASESFLLP